MIKHNVEPKEPGLDLHLLKGRQQALTVLEGHISCCHRVRLLSHFELLFHQRPGTRGTEGKLLSVHQMAAFPRGTVLGEHRGAGGAKCGEPGPGLGVPGGSPCGTAASDSFSESPSPIQAERIVYISKDLILGMRKERLSKGPSNSHANHSHLCVQAVGGACLQTHHSRGLQVLGQPGLHSKTLTQQTTTKTKIPMS